MSKKDFILIAAAAFIIGLAIFVWVGRVNANQCNANNPENCPVPTQICDNGEHVGNPHCDEVTPTTEPTTEVTPTEEVTPTVVPTVAEDVTPTATPSATQTVTPTPQGDGLSSCPECTKAHNGGLVESVAVHMPSTPPATGRGN